MLEYRRTGSVLTGLLLTMAVAACTTDARHADAVWAGDSDGSVRSVAVERRDITSVLALDGVVVAGPRFAVAASDAGTFTADVAARRSLVKAGARLGTIRRDGKERAVVAPVEATVESVEVADGATVQPGLPLVVLKASGFAMRAAVSETQRYRLNELPKTARAQIENGPGPFTCPILGLPAADGDAAEQSGDGAAFAALCGTPGDVRLFPGLRGIVALQTGEARNVPALPVEAVAGVVEKGRVAIRAGNGDWQERDVMLGITDGSYVEVRNGVEVGATVRIPGPDLPSRN